MCEECPRGSYNSDNDSTSCTPCPGGGTTENPGADSDNLCGGSFRRQDLAWFIPVQKFMIRKIDNCPKKCEENYTDLLPEC